uniref:shikimate kinase n=1 Tax=Hirondellea gigas TaxID=1518452 RepID=A0A6A7G6N7_9CRUS
MSFAVFGSVVRDVIITDKQCVDKTYPSFWDDIRRYLGLQLDSQVYKIKDSSKAAREVSSNSTIVIIGMRGAGKTGLGQHLAKVLGFRFADNDHLFEKQFGSVKTFIDTKGWKAFRKAELESFRQHVKEKPTEWVFALGGGIVETEGAREILKTLPIVVEVRRDISDVERYLLSDASRPKFAELPSAVWQRRKQFYQDCSNFEFFIRRGDTNWLEIQKDFGKYGRHLRGFKHPADLGSTIELGTHEKSYFLSLTCRDVNECVPILEKISRGIDALELRVDLLQSTEDEFIKSQIAILRRYSSLPIIFTVRSTSQGGSFAGTDQRAHELNRLAIRLGVEFLDLESQWSEYSRNEILSSRGRSKIIVSHHSPKDNGGSAEDLRQLFHLCSQNGRADIVKVVVSASSPKDAIRMITVANSVRSELPNNPGIISLVMGNHGKLSRVMNRTLTPVTHPLLGRIAAPGQMSVSDIENARTTLGLTQKRKFVIFGSPVRLSPSPNLHNTGFKHLHYSHHYEPHDTDDINEVIKVIRQADFGGASVTIPLKEKVGEHLDELTNSAKRIGAVNTIIKKRSGKLIGDNTDWIGIYRPLKSLLSERPVNESGKEEISIIIGAGGTARAAIYALQQLGFSERILIWNRTKSRAQTLSRQFSCRHLSSLNSPLRNQRVAIVVSTVPGSANFEAPEWILQDNPIIFDVAYLPATTRLSAQASKHNCRTVRGIDMIIEQGLAQFELWTGRIAPADVIRQSVLRKYSQLTTSRL